MEALEYFDCNCSFGMRSIVEPGSFYKIEDLVRKMSHYGINKALVYHSLAREYSPAVGNKLLMDEIKGYDNLYPLWVVMPHHTGEFPQPDELLSEMAENGVKAVRIFPGPDEQGFSIEKWNCGELFKKLEAYKIPLFIGLNQLNWSELHELLSDYPDMNIILTELGYSVDRNLYPLLKKFKNLMIETTGYKVHSGIEHICSEFGAHRLIYGSRMPEHSGGSAVCMINYARISEQEKKMIAGENLARLLGGVLL